VIEDVIVVLTLVVPALLGWLGELRLALASVCVGGIMLASYYIWRRR
jgi:hypothetical protein